MTASAIIIDPTTGVIKRKVMSSPTMLAVQVGAGEALFALVEDDGQVIADDYLGITEAGEWAAKPGAPEGLTVPAAELQYVAV
ncbi:hypothetical protein [Brevundimonas sp. LjRoot202]|uniref:hypothetical protein n=1 Tax=Brevundimonas sp. LjRoot202 TaxID=3342281 RepID=UPI003ECD1A21